MCPTWWKGSASCVSSDEHIPILIDDSYLTHIQININIIIIIIMVVVVESCCFLSSRLNSTYYYYYYYDDDDDDDTTTSGFDDNNHHDVIHPTLTSPRDLSP